jgi:hypothetical protein
LLPQSSTFFKDLSIALPALVVSLLLFFLTREFSAIPVLVLTSLIYLLLLRLVGLPLSFGRSAAFSEQ